MSSRLMIQIVIFVLATSALAAGVIPGRWEKVENLSPGTPVVVRLTAGDRVAGSFEAVSSDTVTLGRYQGGALQLAKDEIKAILGVERVTDNRLDGTLIGLGIGAGSYLGLHAVLCCAPSEAHDAGAALFFGGIGALVGLLADHSVKGPEVYFRAR
ncbi:MAG: hypothetical protein ACE5JX_20335 [Acidobacteriota bacterium]